MKGTHHQEDNKTFDDEISSLPKKRVRTPTLIQMEVAECGAASLGIVMRYYGKYVALPELRVACGVSRDGSNAYNIMEAAKRYGMEAEGLQVPWHELKDLQLPFIVFWNFQHFLVVEGFDEKYVYLNDPASGPRKVTYEEFDAAYTSVVIALKPGPKFVPSGKPPSFLKQLHQQLLPFRFPILFIALAVLGMLVPGISMPVFMQIFIDDIVGSDMKSWQSGFTMALILNAVLSLGFTYLQQYALKRLTIKMNIHFSGDFLWHILRLPVSFYAQRFGGEIANRMGTISQISLSLTGQIATNFINLFLIAFYAIAILIVDWQIGIFAICLAVANFTALVLINRSREDAFARYQQDRGKTIGTAIGGLQNIETLKSSSSETSFYGRWAGFFVKTLNSLQNIGKQDALLAAIPVLTLGLAQAVLLTFGSLSVISGKITLGALMSLQLLMTSFLTPVLSLVNLGTTLQNLKVSIMRLNDVLHNKIDPVFDIPRDPEILAKKPKLEGGLKLEDVCFGFNPLDKPMIADFSLNLKPGDSVAFVGPSGCGKSTLAKLISRLYQPWKGDVLYDGIPSKKLPQEVLVNSIATVDQDITIFEGTFKDNITLWDSTISDEDLVKAAKDACLHDEIMMREGGYEYPLIEGGHNLSGGQRQRIEIARALCKNPTILIMDEATSALDSAVEAEIVKNLKKRGCTAIMVAHRLSTIRDCDEIIVLDKGKIVSRGSHEKLKKQHGLYQNLVKAEGAIDLSC